jgi:hypothetical protein
MAAELKQKEIVPWHDFVAGRYYAHPGNISPYISPECSHTALLHSFTLITHPSASSLFILFLCTLIVSEEWYARPTSSMETATPDGGENSIHTTFSI